MGSDKILCKTCELGLCLEIQSTGLQRKNIEKFFCTVCQMYLDRSGLNFGNYDHPYPRVIKCSKYSKKIEKLSRLDENKANEISSQPELEDPFNGFF